MNNFDNGIQKQCTSLCDVNDGPPLPLSTDYAGQWDLIGKLATKALAQTAAPDGNAAANSSSSL